ncbi:MAG: nucleotidyltransferase domain-containing protein [Nanoarchaeota archaeon]
MQNIQFIHKISKGSKFNQIYIPKEMEADFEVGDSVEVKLLKKKEKVYYSKNLDELSDFKEKLIKEIFSILNKFNEIRQIFAVGSFLTQKVDYNDIDLIVVINKNKNEKLEENIYNGLIEKINLKFHIIAIQEDKLNYLEKNCPLTKSMFYYHISNKEFNSSAERNIDKKHIKFLLMMSEDLLEINAGSKNFYDNIRRLITIERFLKQKDLNPKEINKELELILNDFGKNILSLLKNNEQIDEKTLKKLRRIIKEKLSDIKKNLNKNEQE